MPVYYRHSKRLVEEGGCLIVQYLTAQYIRRHELAVRPWRRRRRR